MRRRSVVFAMATVLVSSASGPDSSALAQSSASYRLEEHGVNAAGHPTQGTILVSTGGPIGFRMTLDAAGDSMKDQTMVAPGSVFQLVGGLVAGYPPPGEVTNLELSSDTVTLSWDPESSAGEYNLYRGLLSTLPGLGYGTCAQSGLSVPTTTDADAPPVGDGRFYLVTARNRLREEGTKGFDSSGGERPNLSPCP